MNAYLTINILGVFAFDEKNRIISKSLFKNNSEDIILKLKELEHNQMKEIKKSVSDLKGYDLVIENSDKIQKFKMKRPEHDMNFLGENFDVILDNINCSRESYNKLLHEVCIKKGEMDLQEHSTRKDKDLIQAITALQQLDEILNMLIERAREWRALDSLFFEDTTIESKKLFENILKDDNTILKDFSKAALKLQKYRNNLEEQINELMILIAPNITALTGPLLGARLIALAKGVENLALMPGSRIQLLGSKKAFFKNKKNKLLPPKHGAIFQHPLIKGAPWWQRGKISRSLGSKIALASRIDVFSKKYIGDKLKEDFNKRVKKIHQQYPNAPEKMRIIRRNKR